MPRINLIALILLAILLMATTSTAVAQRFDQEPSQANFYAGAQVGFDNVEVKTSTSNTKLNSGSLSGVGFDGYLGVRQNSDLGTLGLEGTVGYSTADFLVDDGTDRIKLEREENFGASGLFGQKVGNALIYARFGWHWVNASATLNGASDSERFNGPRFGAGAEIELGESISVRTEWTRTLYQKEQGFEPSESVFRIGLTFTSGQ